MSNGDEAKEALDKLNQKDFNGKTLKVEFSKRKKNHNSYLLVIIHTDFIFIR